MTDVIPTRLRVEAGAPTKEQVLEALEQQAKVFFGDEEYRLDGDVNITVESMERNVGGRVIHVRWAGWADYVNYREEPYRPEERRYSL